MSFSLSSLSNDSLSGTLPRSTTYLSIWRSPSEGMTSICFNSGYPQFFSGIKKPACGRLLGDWLGLFLVSLASLQNVHPDLRPAVGLGQTLVCHVGRCLSRGAGRCANVGRRILSFAMDSQSEVRFRATAVVEIGDLCCIQGLIASRLTPTGGGASRQIRETARPAGACPRSTTRTPSPVCESFVPRSVLSGRLRPGIRRCCGCAVASRCRACGAGI